MFELVLARAIPRYQGKDLFPGFVICKGTQEECNAAAQSFADNNPNWMRLTWEWREVK